MKGIKHKAGQKATVEVYNYKTRSVDLIKCKILNTVSALDRPYRINVLTHDGRTFNGCAPECVH